MYAYLLVTYFMWLLSAIGCANPVLGPGMWLRRDPASLSDDIIIIGCRMTDERWRLTCVGEAWTGDVIGNCSTATGTTMTMFISYTFAR